MKKDKRFQEGVHNSYRSFYKVSDKTKLNFLADKNIVYNTLQDSPYFAHLENQ